MNNRESENKEIQKNKYGHQAKKISNFCIKKIIN
jgi:hypothetical protein